MSLAPGRLGRRLFAVVVAIVVALALAELALRAGGLESRVRFSIESETLVPHPRRFFALEPEHRATPAHIGRYATGAWPFRGRPPADPALGLVRIAVLGDSCMYGDGADPSRTLPHQLEMALAARGFDRTRLQVLNYGVQAYTSIQMVMLLEELFAGPTPPDHVVVYAGAWNDLGPALGPNDLVLRQWAEFEAGFFGRFALARRLVDLPRVESVALDKEIIDLWIEGRPPLGRRVPPADLGRTIREIAERCGAAGAFFWMLGPAHPHDTVVTWPVTREDAAIVAAAVEEASAGGAPAELLDVQPIFAASGWGDPRLFVDRIHPSVEAHALIVDALAERLAAVLPPLPAGGPPPPLEVEPRAVPVLGDVDVRFHSLGARLEGAFAVMVGGSLVLDARRDGDDVVGRLGADVEGVHDVLVQSAAGVELYPGLVERRPISWELERDGTAATLHLDSRPGDTALVSVADRRRKAPHWQREGAFWLDPSTPPLTFQVECDAEGRASVALDRLPPGAAFHAQALVLARGLGEEHVELARWSPAFSAAE